MTIPENYLEYIKPFFEKFLPDDNISLFSWSNWEKILPDTQEELGEEYFTDIASGVSKVVLWNDEDDFVVKIPCSAREKSDDSFEGCDSLKYNSFSWDYCAKEAYVYNKAKKYEVEMYFAECQKIGEIKGFPIYVQQKATILSESDRCTTDEDIEFLKQSESDTVWDYEDSVGEIAECWVADFIKNYGEDEFENLIEFLEDYDVADLHSDNVGYIDDIPVLIDYSGFDD